MIGWMSARHPARRRASYTVPELLGPPARPARHRVRVAAPDHCRRVLRVAAAVLVAGVLVLTVATRRPGRPARVELTAAQVSVGGYYYAAASGFRPGESVEFSWTGPTVGVMTTVAADGDGRVGVPGPIVEADPPGAYRIVATGLGSHTVVSADLEVSR